MTTDFRALCAELAEKLDEFDRLLHGAQYVEHPLTYRARAALAEPQPEGPTEDEIYKLALEGDFLVDVGDGFTCMVQDEVAFARAVLARWGRPS